MACRLPFSLKDCHSSHLEPQPHMPLHIFRMQYIYRYPHSDGMAIAQAVLEYLDAMCPRTLFATHYHELTALSMDNVSCLTIDVREHNDEIIFMHKIVAGVANRSYGIHVARMAGMPSSVIARAECVLSALESNEPVQPTATCAPIPKPARRKTCVSDNLPQPQLSLFG